MLYQLSYTPADRPPFRADGHPETDSAPEGFKASARHVLSPEPRHLAGSHAAGKRRAGDWRFCGSSSPLGGGGSPRIRGGTEGVRQAVRRGREAPSTGVRRSPSPDGGGRRNADRTAPPGVFPPCPRSTASRPRPPIARRIGRWNRRTSGPTRPKASRRVQRPSRPARPTVASRRRRKPTLGPARANSSLKSRVIPEASQRLSGTQGMRERGANRPWARLFAALRPG
jgi:hypothetical protein